MTTHYKTGNGNSLISIAVKLGTVGTSCTLIQSYGKGIKGKTIIESNDDGNIRKTTIGKASDVNGTYITVVTTIDFSNIDESNWNKQPDLITLKYTIDGGNDGSVKFNFDKNDLDIIYNGKEIMVSTLIIFI